MEQLKRLLKDLERISFQDISEISEKRQHEVAEQIE
jgi:ribosomal protein S18